MKFETKIISGVTVSVTVAKGQQLRLFAAEGAPLRCALHQEALQPSLAILKNRRN